MLTVDDAIIYLGYDEVDEAIKTVVSTSSKARKAICKEPLARTSLTFCPTIRRRTAFCALILTKCIMNGRD